MENPAQQIRNRFLEALANTPTPTDPPTEPVATEELDCRPLQTALYAIACLQAHQRHANRELHHHGDQTIIPHYRWSQLDDAIIHAINALTPLLDLLADVAGIPVD